MSSVVFDPINNGFSEPPEPYPLGFPIKSKISVGKIRGKLANQIHQTHHSYVSEPRHGVVDHGIFLQDDLVGAITYSYMLASEPIHGYESDEYIEVARVTIANETPNLASCAMAKSQKRFIEDYASENDIGLLVTYVHEGWEGSMFAALEGLGWEHDGHIAEGHQAGNRKTRKIREYDKKRWVCEL